MATGAQIQALTDALTAFTTAIGTLAPSASGGAPAPAAHVPIHDLTTSADAFDLYTRAGLDALKEISKPLDCTCVDFGVFALSDQAGLIHLEVSFPLKLGKVPIS